LFVLHNKRVQRKLSAIAVIAIMLGILAPIPWHAAYAVPSLSDTYLRMNRMKASQATDFRLVFKPATAVAANGKVKITFPAGFTVNATQTASSATCAAESGAAAMPGVSGPTSSGQTISVTTTAGLSAATLYCVDLTSVTAVTNHATPGGYVPTVFTTTSGDVTIDSKTIGLRVISDDQIVVTAVVPPTFDFALSGNTDAFTASLDPTAVRTTTGRTITISTNAAKGWIAWVKDSNQGLTSASASYTIPTAGTINATPNTLSAGTEGYVLDVNLTTDSGNGTPSIAGEYNGVAASSGGTLSGTFQVMASSTGTALGDVLTLIEYAAINGETKAGDDYTDTLTVVGAGYF